jgi:PAS domain S-box-containing protein
MFGDWPTGEGEMAARIRAFDWPSTPLGPVTAWPQSLKTALDICLNSGFACFIGWGPQLIHLYNDPALPIVGAKHPTCLGRPASEVWREIWSDIGPLLDEVLTTGRPVTRRDMQLQPDRGAGPETAYFTLTYSPLRDEAGATAGVMAVAIETTAQVTSDAALRDSEARLRHLVETFAQATWETDVDGVVVTDSPSWRAYTGQTLEDCSGRAWLGAIHPDDRPQAERQWREAVAEGREVNGEFRLRCAAGGWRWTKVRAAPVPGPDGEIRKWVGMNIDITDWHEAEVALRESEERLRLALDVGQLATWDWNLGDGRLTWSDEHYRVQGYEPGEITPTYEAWAARMHPDDLPGAEAALAVARERREPYAHEFRVLRPGGEIRWVASRGRYFYDEQGQAVRMIGVMQDVTEARRAVEDLRESQERFRQFADASSDVLWIRNAESLELEFLSPSFQRMYGMTVDAALGGDTLTTWTDLIAPADREHALAFIDNVRSGARVTFEYRVRRADNGEVRWIRDTDFPIRDGAGRVRRIGGVGHDVTEEKKAAHHQAMLLAELQHRTRNLLGVIRSVARRTAETSDDLESFLTHFDGRLSAIARTQTALTRNQAVSASLDAVVLEEFLAAAGAEQVTLDGPEVQLSGKVAESISLAVHELVTNALKYGALTTPKGHVYVTWEVSERDGRPVLALDWRETGVGVIDVQPRRIGFGRRLLEKALPYELGALTTLRFAPGGLRASIEVPLQAEGEQEISNG